MNLWLIFLTGLTTGGISCVAVQGGLLTSMIANQKATDSTKPKKSKTALISLGAVQLEQDDVFSIASFLGAKLLSHTVLGALLGLLGSAISLDLTMRLTFQIFTALFMFATAMNLLQVHPMFRFLSFQPPKFIRRHIRSASKSNSIFAPGILGLLTIFIPCGVTQAMEVVAINTGNPVQGALIMFAFVLGTIPLFSIIGIILTKLSETWHAVFNKVAAFALIALALYSFNGVAVVLDSPLSFQHLTRGIVAALPIGTSDTQLTAKVGQVQEVTISVQNSGYAPRNIKVKQNVPVQLTLQSKDVYSCALSFVFKEFGISTFLKSTDTQTFTFTPTKKGVYTFACSMGMYTGTFEVV